MPVIRILMVVTTAALLLAACGDDDDVTTATTTSSSTTTEATTTTEAGDDGTPATIVAVTADGRAVVLDATDGNEIRTLLEGIDIQPAKNDVAVSPDGETAYVVRPAAGQAPTPDSQIVAVPTTGGEGEVVVTGLAPSVSPDGSTLAYVAFEGGEGRQPPVPVIVLRDLETGDEQRLARDEQPDFTFIADTAWALDGTTLAFVAGEIQTGLFAVHTSASTELDAARRLGPTARGEASWRAVTALDEDRFAVVETCCDVGPKERWLVLAVNIEQAVAEGGVLPGERTEASRLDADPGADGLLLVTDVTPEGGALLRWTGGEPTELATGIIAAAW